MEDIVRQLALQVSEQLPQILQNLQAGGFDPVDNPLQLECTLTAGNGHHMDSRVPVTALNIGRDFTPVSSVATTPQSHTNGFSDTIHGASSLPDGSQPASPTWAWRTGGGFTSPDDSDSRPNKRRKDTGVTSGRTGYIFDRTRNGQASNTSLVIRDDGPRKKRTPDNPALQPSTFEKFISGVVSESLCMTTFKALANFDQFS